MYDVTKEKDFFLTCGIYLYGQIARILTLNRYPVYFQSSSWKRIHFDYKSSLFDLANTPVVFPINVALYWQTL